MTVVETMSGILAVLLAASSGPPVCSPSDHGGRPGDDISDTVAIQRAVDVCKGTGGTVSLAPGQWETGPLQFGSDMTFRLEEGAVLALIPDIELYPADPRTRSDDLRRQAFFADKVRRLTFEGPGVIEGRGASFWDENFYETGLKRPTLPRPAPTLAIVESEDVVIRNLTLRNLPGFGIAFVGSSDSLVEGVTIRNDQRSPNTDGIQIRNSSRITVRGADIETGDDGIVLKSNGRRVDRILVEDSRIVSDDGAIKFGTGSRVGVTNSVFRNIDIEDSRYGVAIFMIDGGHHDNNLFEDIQIKTGGRHTRTYPIFVDIDRREVDRSLGKITGLTFRDLTVRSSGGSLIAGNPRAKIKGLVLERVSVEPSGEPDEPLDRSGKPRGNKNIRDQEGSVDYSDVRAEFVIAHTDSIELSSVSLPGCQRDAARDGLVLIDAEADLSEVENAKGCPSTD
ncbi:MAG: glycosyl hydrolase family 28 protein [Pseudomonadota bacterium]